MKTKSFKEILKETIQRNCTDDYDGMFLFFESSVIEAHNEYASQFQQELPNIEDIVKKFIDSDEPDTFIRNEHGALMYYSHDGKSGINLESYFEDLVQYVYDEMSAKSPQPYNPKQS